MTRAPGSGSGSGGAPHDATAETLASGPAIVPPPPSRPGGDAGAYEGLVEVDQAHYRLDGELARGGMGRIVIARDRRLDRAVALKMLRDDSATLRGRFKREVRITARLQHPAIVPVYEAGRLGDEPFYAMKLVSGRPFDQVIAAEVELGGRLALLPSVIAVAEALAFAHDRGIVHRDVKPQNVLIGKFGETVLIDWGLAKEMGEAEALPDTRVAAAPLAANLAETMPATVPGRSPPAIAESARETDPGRAGDSGGSSDSARSTDKGRSSLTVAGDVMGTPAYMPPEQARGAEVDERADVYAIGAVLYHVLAGAPPYLGASSWDVVEQVQLGPPRPLEELASETPADLRAIVDKAMARDPAERYPTAKELAEDLRRFQTGQLVGVHAYTAMEHLRRFLARHRAAVVVAASAAALILILGIVGTARIASERADALAQRNEARQGRADALEAGQRAASASARAQGTLLEFIEEQGRQELLAGRIGRAATYLAEAYRGGRDSPALRLLLAAAMRPLDAQLWSYAGKADEDVRQVVASADARRIAFGLVDESVILLDGHTGQVVAHLADAGEAASGLDLAADGSRLVTGGPDGNVRVWDAGSGKPLGVFAGEASPVLSVALSADGTRIAAANAEGETRLLEARSGKRLATLKTRSAVAIARFTAERLLLVPSWQFVEPADRARAEVSVWDVGAGAGRALYSIAPGEDARVAADAAVAHLAVARDDRIEIHDVRARQVLRTIVTRTPVRELGMSPSGTRVVVVDDDGAIAVYDVANGALVTREAGATSPAYVADFLDDGTLWAIHADDVVRLWDAERGVEAAAFEAPGRNSQLVVGGSRLVLVAGSAAIAWDMSVAATLAAKTGGAGETVLALDARGGRAVVVAGAELRLYDATSGGVLATHAAPEGGVRSAEVAEGGGRTLLAGAAGAVSVVDAKLAPLPALEGGAALPARLSPDGARVLGVSGDALVMWDAASGRRLETLPGRAEGARVIAFDGGGARAAVGTSEGTLRIYDVARGAGTLAQDIASGGSPDQPTFSPDGLRVLAIVAGQVRVWDAQSGAAAFTIDQPRVYDAAFSPDGKWIAAVGGDRRARVWSAATGQLVAELDGHGGDVLAVAFDPRAEVDRVVTCADDGRVRVFEATSGRLLVVHDARSVGRALRVAADGAHMSVVVDGVALTWVLGEEQRPVLDVAARVGARARWRLTNGRMFARPLGR
jgi:serine/threonine protein kinase/WD40 repeat protein